MNLEELKMIVDNTIKHLHYEKPNEVPVLITLTESSMGARAATSVRYANMGFDWEKGQFRLEPNEKLVKRGNSLTDVKSVECREYEGKKYYFCPRCQQKISKNDRYCRYCSQKLK